MAGLESILAVAPDLQMLNDFCKKIEVDIIILYSPEIVNQDCAYRTRVFAPTFGYLEDPATGSGNSAFGYYLLRNNMWNGEKIRVEQNGFRDTPNFVQIVAKKTDTEECQVWFGGGAVLKIEGQYILNPTHK
jgi:PhzF family phenazine biosynthesis protein